MQLGILGKKALIAGGSAGMGKECALALAQEGVDVTISARSEARLVASAQEIARSTGRNVTSIVADHSTANGRAELLANCSSTDILVITCTPPPITESFSDIGPDDWDQALATAFLGPVELMRAMIPGMKERGFGRIVNIATIGAKTGHENRLLSGSPRAALCNYSASIARPLSRYNVIINSILPGMFRTAGAEGLFRARAERNGTTNEMEADKWIESLNVPARRFGEPSDVGAMCALLCSQHASYIVGQSIVMDGGLMRSVF